MIYKIYNNNIKFWVMYIVWGYTFCFFGGAYLSCVHQSLWRNPTGGGSLVSFCGQCVIEVARDVRAVQRDPPPPPPHVWPSASPKSRGCSPIGPSMHHIPVVTGTAKPRGGTARAGPGDPGTHVHMMTAFGRTPDAEMMDSARGRRGSASGSGGVRRALPRGRGGPGPPIAPWPRLLLKETPPAPAPGVGCGGLGGGGRGHKNKFVPKFGLKFRPL